MSPYQSGGDGEKSRSSEHEVITGHEAMPKSTDCKHSHSLVMGGSLIDHPTKPDQSPLVPAVDVHLETGRHLGTEVEKC